MLEAERQKLNELNRELAVARANCWDLKKTVDRIGKMITRRENKIKELLDRKE